MEHDRRLNFLHWITRVEVKTPNKDIPVVTEYGPYAFEHDATRKATLLRDVDYADYFATKDDKLRSKWREQGPPFSSIEVDPYPDLDDNQIIISVRNISISRTSEAQETSIAIRRPSNSGDAPRDDSDDDIESDTEEHTGLEATPRPYVNWHQHEDGTHYRHLDGWMVVVALRGKETVFGPYVSQVQASRMKRKLAPIVDKAAIMIVRHEAHM
jgi:hypothetical protein